MRLALVLLVLIASTVDALSLNECGGLNALSSKLGALCDASEIAECPFGRTACHGNDAVMCSPDCSITTQHVLNLVRAPTPPSAPPPPPPGAGGGGWGGGRGGGGGRE